MTDVMPKLWADGKLVLRDNGKTVDVVAYANDNPSAQYIARCLRAVDVALVLGSPLELPKCVVDAMPPDTTPTGLQKTCPRCDRRGEVFCYDAGEDFRYAIVWRPLHPDPHLIMETGRPRRAHVQTVTFSIPPIVKPFRLDTNVTDMDLVDRDFGCGGDLGSGS